MKAKFFLPLLAALFMSSALMAQFHIGLKGGSNITKIDGHSFKDKFGYGYHIGGFAEIGLGEKLGIQPEVLFSQYSTTLDSSYNHIYQDIFTSGQSKVKLNYLSIPVLLNYKVIGNFLSLQVGPQFSILMKQDKNLLQNGADAFKKGDFAMLGGVQLKLSAIRITGRYVVGLNNISDIDNKDQWKSQGFQVSLGLAL
ncbi:MAG: porin family protein [Chitinophagaceae bacterium]